MYFRPSCVSSFYYFFFFTETAPTEIYTLSLHDALPISTVRAGAARRRACSACTLAAIASRVSSLTSLLRSEEHTSELQSHHDLVCRLLLEKKKKKQHEKCHITQQTQRVSNFRTSRR